jgi:hypothetical protein
MKVLIMLFFPVYWYVLLLYPNILHDFCFSHAVRLYSSLNVKDQVSEVYKTTGKIRSFVCFKFLCF